jgi:hypothetical protein
VFPSVDSARIVSPHFQRLAAALFLLPAFGLLPGVAAAVERLQVPSEILARAERVRSPALDYAVDFRLDVVDPSSSWKKRHARYTMIAHGKDQSLVLMREPEQFYPGTLLIDRGFYWLLLPRSDRAFQLSPRHVLNGDISNGDLARGNLLKFYDPTLVGEDTIDDRPCYRLMLTRKSNLGLYSRILCWIDVEDFRPRRFQYFGNTGALLKTADYKDYRKGELGVRSMRIEVSNHARPGEHTTLTFDNLREFDSSDLSFTRESLSLFRDAALAILDATEAQATPEQIRTRLVAKP